MKFIHVLLLVLACQFLTGQQPVYKYKIAIIGNPANADIRYDASQLDALKKLGFNTIQLNIAWGARPADEPLNLEDILYVPGIGNEGLVNKRMASIKIRALTVVPALRAKGIELSPSNALR